MASSVTKHASGQWCFSFYSTAMKDQGYPARQFFYFPPEFTKRQVKEIRDEWNLLYKKGDWNPWTDPRPGMPSKSVSIHLKQAISEYKNGLHRELSENTIEYTALQLKYFYQAVGDRDISTLTGNQISDYINAVDNYNSRRTVDYVLNRFFDWLVTRGHLKDRPVINMVSTEAEKKQQRRYPITSDKLPDLIKAFEDIRDEKLKNKHTSKNIVPVYERHIEMTQILFYMGLRMSDILHLRPAWILDKKLLRIGDLKEWGLPDEYHPKSQKEFDPPIAIPKEVRSILLERAKRYKRFERIFEITYARRFQEPFKLAATKAFGKSFASHFTPHSLRHSCATYWLNERKVPVQEVQRLMRHADIKTTMGYYHPSIEAHLEAFL